MKILKTILCLSALVTLSLVSGCKKIDEPATLPSNEVTLTINTSAVEFDADTKTSIDGLVPSWSEGDKIGVFVNTTVNSEFSSTLSGDKKKATFSGIAELSAGDNLIYAFYPYTNFTTNAYNAVRTVIPTTQSPSMTSFDPMADIMVGKPYTYNWVGSGNAAIDGFQFKRIMTVVKLSFTYSGTLLGSDKVEKVTMISGEAIATTGATAASNGVLAGGMVLNLTDGTHTPSDVAGGNTRTNYVSADYLPIHNFIIDAEGTCSAYLVINPLTLTSGKKLTFLVTTTSHKIARTVTLTSDKVFKAGSLQPIKVAIEDANISDFPHKLPYVITATSGANATYTDWTANGWTIEGNQTTCVYGMRLGTGDKIGSVTSLPISGFTDYVKVSFHALGWNAETPKVFISLIKADGTILRTVGRELSGSGISSDGSITSEIMNGVNALQTVVFSGASECVKVKIATTTIAESEKLRFFLSYVKVEEAQASDYHAATVETNDATNIAGQLATLNGAFSPNDDEIEEFGFYWKKTSDEPFTKVALSGSTNSYNLTGLTPETSYTFKAFIKVPGSDSETFGEEKTFITLGLQSAVATTGIADEITKTGAKLHGTFDKKDGNAPTEVGFKYKESSSLDDFTTLALAQVSYTWGSLTGLSIATEYTYKAYMIVDGVTYEGDPLTFTTLNPTVTVNSPLTVTSANGSTGELSVVVDNGVNWTAAISEGAKFTLSPTSGTGNGTITVTATEANASTTDEAILGTVTITLTDYPSITATSQVKQLPSGAAPAKYYQLVTEAPTDWTGTYLIVGIKSAKYYTISAQASNSLTADKEVTVEANKIEQNAETSKSELRVAKYGATVFYTFQLSSTLDTSADFYLYCASTTSKAYLRSTATVAGDKYAFSMDCTSDGKLTAIAQTSSDITRNIVRFNSSTNPGIFSCYASGQSDVYIYKLSE